MFSEGISENQKVGNIKLKPIYNRNNYYYGAVGSVGMISFLFFSLCMGLSSGIGVIVSNCFGAKKEEEVKTAIANSIYVMSGGCGHFLGLYK
ncbi:MATE family efflux transporter [Coprococcus sp. RTP21428st1_B10_RTP21428_210409]|uniref:MATE family efflux transporter n=1 Tax=Coprococcus sp. RTP21428st1_B10_RTP21428_210409 TaxID=3153687 RepID=UPI0032EE4837